MTTNEQQETTVPTRRRDIRRWLSLAARVAGFGLVPVLGGLAFLYALQTRLIFPGAATQGAPEADFIPPTGTELLELETKRGETVTAIFAPALSPQGSPDPDAPRRPTLLYFYGNGMCLADSVEYNLDRLRRLGVNVVIPDYLGYGKSGGTASEAGCYETAETVFAHLLTRNDLDPKRIVAAGRSLGGAVAIDLAARRDVAGLVAFATFSSLTEMSRRHYPLAPASLLLRYKFDSLSKIGRVRCPILLCHGRLDRLVPATMSETLAASTRAPVTLSIVEGADHNDLFELGGDSLFESFRRFLHGIESH